MRIHELDIVHQDFHPGNILSSNFKNRLEISDFGLITGFSPYSDKDLAMKICNELRPKIPFNTPKLIRRVRYSEIGIQLKKQPNFQQESTNTTTATTTPLNYQTHPQAIYTSRLLNYSNPRMEKISKRDLKN
ncbi:hypothetical protein Glove_50g53 [Diversispora epigaea]|uniref:Protein kinase domain-containing protein n=1 Tax=Diversispora epigaea TaxID=1348612 RepID=A0A397JNI0_9GLOM|nr:hypothetical protein Glove_50g53 [Diversispora epigaea]